MYERLPVANQNAQERLRNDTTADRSELRLLRAAEEVVPRFGKHVDPQGHLPLNASSIWAMCFTSSPSPVVVSSFGSSSGGPNEDLRCLR